MHICLPADESNPEVTYAIQDDGEGLVIAADGNHCVWRGAFPGGQGDPVAGQGIFPTRWKLKPVIRSQDGHKLPPENRYVIR